MKRSNSSGEAPLSKRDINFLRFLDQSYPAGSTMQLGQRDKLRMIIDIFETIVFLIRAVYKHLKKKKTDAGAAAIDNLAKAITGEFPNVSIDFSKVSILSGDLASPCGSMHHIPGSDKLSFSWGNCAQCNSNRTDELMAMIYRPDTSEFWCEQNLGITRADGFCTIDVPANFHGASVHVWLAYRSADQKEYSDSRYMGVRSGYRTVSSETGLNELNIQSQGHGNE